MRPLPPETRPSFSASQMPRQTPEPASTQTHPSVLPIQAAQSAARTAGVAQLPRLPSHGRVASACPVLEPALRVRALRTRGHRAVDGYLHPACVRQPFHKTSASRLPSSMLPCALPRFAAGVPATAPDGLRTRAHPVAGSAECVHQISSGRVLTAAAGVPTPLRASRQTSMLSLDNPAAIPRQNRHIRARPPPQERLPAPTLPVPSALRTFS